MTETISLWPRWRSLIVNWLKPLNVFESYSNDVDVIRLERGSTWVFLVLLLVSLIIVVIYAGSVPRTKIVKTFRPSEDEFKKLCDKFPDTLKCPCSQVAIQYSYFTNIDVKFHEVCESQFITQNWIDSVYHVNVSIIPPNDVRTIMSNFWQFIRAFCNLTKDTFTNAYTDFNATILLTPITQSQFFIETNVEASLNFSVTSAVSNLKRNLFISRETTLVNGFMSSLGTNYHMESVYDASSPDTATVQSHAEIFEDGCVCSNLRGCPRPVSIFNLNTKSIETNITGMIFDCLLLDGVLASSLECFYQSSCLSLLLNETIIPIGVQPFNALSRFTQTTTIGQLLTELMIEKLTKKIHFLRYYTGCNPAFCTYSYTRRFDVLFVITMVVGTYGGLSVILRFLSPVLIKLIIKIYKWKTGQHSIENNGSHQLTNRISILFSRKL
ncbi:unnamed protein product [Rotaria sp. Silwood1]|nr:unnamed protein product [Rotaria sp. Silwood1]